MKKNFVFAIISTLFYGKVYGQDFSQSFSLREKVQAHLSRSENGTGLTASKISAALGIKATRPPLSPSERAFDFIAGAPRHSRSFVSKSFLSRNAPHQDLWGTYGSLQWELKRSAYRIACLLGEESGYSGDLADLCRPGPPLFFPKVVHVLHDFYSEIDRAVFENNRLRAVQMARHTLNFILDVSDRAGGERPGCSAEELKETLRAVFSIAKALPLFDANDLFVVERDVRLREQPQRHLLHELLQHMRLKDNDDLNRHQSFVLGLVLSAHPLMEDDATLVNVEEQVRTLIEEERRNQENAMEGDRTAQGSAQKLARMEHDLTQNRDKFLKMLETCFIVARGPFATELESLKEQQMRELPNSDLHKYNLQGHLMYHDRTNDVWFLKETTVGDGYCYFHGVMQDHEKEMYNCEKIATSVEKLQGEDRVFAERLVARNLLNLLRQVSPSAALDYAQFTDLITSYNAAHELVKTYPHILFQLEENVQERVLMVFLNEEFQNTNKGAQFTRLLNTFRQNPTRIPNAVQNLYPAQKIEYTRLFNVLIQKFKEQADKRGALDAYLEELRHSILIGEEEQRKNALQEEAKVLALDVMRQDITLEDEKTRSFLGVCISKILNTLMWQTAPNDDNFAGLFAHLQKKNIVVLDAQPNGIDGYLDQTYSLYITDPFHNYRYLHLSEDHYTRLIPIKNMATDRFTPNMELFTLGRNGELMATGKTLTQKDAMVHP